MSGNSKICAVIIAAYDCPEYINQCIAGFLTQKPLSGWQYNLRLGVDGCKRTAEKIKGTKYYYSYNNVGAYVMRNSLINISKADAYAYFDADDIMLPDYLSKSLLAIENHEIVMTAKIQTDRNMQPLNRCIQDGGAMTFTHNLLEILGGFAHYRCACDTDFMRRVIMAGYDIHKIQQPLYYRRIHPKQLTKAKTTGIGSEYRKKAWREMTQNREKGLIYIKPRITDLKQC